MKKLTQLSMLFVTVGCITFSASAAVFSQTKPVVTAPVMTSTTDTNTWFPEQNEVTLCKSRLSALKTFNPVSWKQLNNEFNTKMQKWYYFNDYRFIAKADGELARQYESGVLLTCLKVKNSMNNAMLKAALR